MMWNFGVTSKNLLIVIIPLWLTTGCNNPSPKTTASSNNFHPGISVDIGTSTLTIATPTVVSGSTTQMTFSAFDKKGNPYKASDLPITFNTQGGTSTGTFSKPVNNRDGTFTITFTAVKAGTPSSIVASINGLTLTTTAPQVTVTPGTFAIDQSTISLASPQIEASLNMPVTFTARDLNGNQVTSATGMTVTFSHTGGTSTGTFGTVTDNQDGTYSASFTGTGIGTATTIHASANGVPLTGSLPTITVVAGAASTSQSTLTATANTVTSGSSITLTVVAKDAFSHQQSTGGLNVTFAYSGGTSTGTFGPTVDNNDGTYTTTFTGVVSGTATTLQAFFDSSVLTSTLPTVTVTTGPAVSFEVTGHPVTVTAGSTNGVIVTAKDVNNNTVTGYTGTITFSSSDPSATLPSNYLFLGSDNGTRAFNNVSLKTAGSRSITATDIDTGSIIGSQSNITVISGSVSTFAFSNSFSSVTAGQGTHFTLTALDSYGNTVTTYTGTVHFTSTDTLATLPSDYSFLAANNGVRAFSTTFNTLGTQSITATDTVSGSVTATLTGISVNP